MRYRIILRGLSPLVCRNGAAGLDTRSPANIEKGEITRKKTSDRTEVDDVQPWALVPFRQSLSELLLGTQCCAGPPFPCRLNLVGAGPLTCPQDGKTGFVDSAAVGGQCHLEILRNCFEGSGHYRFDDTFPLPRLVTSL